MMTTSTVTASTTYSVALTEFSFSDFSLQSGRWRVASGGRLDVQGQTVDMDDDGLDARQDRRLIDVACGPGCAAVFDARRLAGLQARRDQHLVAEREPVFDEAGTA